MKLNKEEIISDTFTLINNLKHELIKHQINIKEIGYFNTT